MKSAREVFKNLENNEDWDDFDPEVQVYKHYFCVQIYQESGETGLAQKECEAAYAIIEDEESKFFETMKEKFDALCQS